MRFATAMLVAACFVQRSRSAMPPSTTKDSPALVFSPTFEDRSSKVILAGNQTVTLKANTLTVRSKHSRIMRTSLNGDAFCSCTATATKLAVCVQGGVLGGRHRVILFDVEKVTMHSMDIEKSDGVRFHGNGQKVSYLKSTATLVTTTVDGDKKTKIKKVASFDASDTAGLLYIQGGVLKRDYQRFCAGDAYRKVCVDDAGHVMAWDGESLRVLDAVGTMLSAYAVRTAPVSCHFDGHVLRLLDERGDLMLFERYSAVSVYSNLSQPIVANRDLTQFSTREGIATFAAKATSWYSDEGSPFASHILQIISEYVDFPVAKRVIAVTHDIPQLPALAPGDVHVAVNRQFLNCRDGCVFGHHFRKTSNAPIAVARLQSPQLRVTFASSLNRPPFTVENYPGKLGAASFSRCLAYMFALSKTDRFDVIRTLDGARVWSKRSVQDYMFFEAHGLVLLQNSSKEGFWLMRIEDGASVRKFLYENYTYPVFRIHMPHLYFLDTEDHTFQRLLIAGDASSGSSKQPSPDVPATLDFAYPGRSLYRTLKLKEYQDFAFHRNDDYIMLVTKCGHFDVRQRSDFSLVSSRLLAGLRSDDSLEGALFSEDGTRLIVMIAKSHVVKEYVVESLDLLALYD